MGVIRLSFNKESLKAEVALPASKSISNRLLILNALASQPRQIYGLSEAQDTKTLHLLLQSKEDTLDVGDAGTAMRFLLAYCALRKPGTTLTGSNRMLERPQGALIKALRDLGAEIKCLGKEGFAPLIIEKTISSAPKSVSIRGDISSQYISALMMIGPYLEDGIEIKLTTPLSSRPYVIMTAALMGQFGVATDVGPDKITITPARYKAVETWVERDWSAASYWYAIAALASGSEILLKGLTLESIQGDAAIDQMMQNFGVSSRTCSDGVWLYGGGKISDALTVDMTDTPDLAQTMMVVAAAKDIALTLHGCESLSIKETDRIAAMKSELANLGVTFSVEDGYIHIGGEKLRKPKECISTYGDHRMAMSFAPIAVLYPIAIENPEVVKKSYPQIWIEMSNAGFVVEYI